jgi:hypothetical protein
LRDEDREEPPDAEALAARRRFLEGCIEDERERLGPDEGLLPTTTTTAGD